MEYESGNRLVQLLRRKPIADVHREAGEHLLNRTLGRANLLNLGIGAIIGSGIFVVSAESARRLGSSWGLLGVWIAAGALTVAAALSCGELAAMLPKAGGPYAFFREAYGPLAAFLFGWTLFLVVQTGTIAAVAVAFARFAAVLVPALSERVGPLSCMCFARAMSRRM